MLKTENHEYHDINLLSQDWTFAFTTCYFDIVCFIHLVRGANYYIQVNSYEKIVLYLYKYIQSYLSYLTFQIVNKSTKHDISCQELKYF